MFKRLFYWAYFRGSLFSERLIIGRNFAFQNGFGLSLKTAKNSKITASLTLTVHGLIFGRIFAYEIWVAYFREGLFLGELIIGYLRYSTCFIAVGFAYFICQNFYCRIIYNKRSNVVRLQRTRLDSNLSVPRPGETDADKFHELEFNFGKYPSYLFF